MKGLMIFLLIHRIDLTKQNFKRVKTHLFKHYKEERSISATAINNFLSRIFEHNEINREYLDSNESSADTGDWLVSVILTADNRRSHSRKALIAVTTIVSCLIVTLFLYLQTSSLDQPMTIVQSKDLKSLVSKVVEIEKSQNNKMSHNAVWKTLKELKVIKKDGYKASYKNFTQGQYVAAKTYLEEWIEKTKKVSLSNPESN